MGAHRSITQLSPISSPPCEKVSIFVNCTSVPGSTSHSRDVYRRILLFKPLDTFKSAHVAICGTIAARTTAITDNIYLHTLKLRNTPASASFGINKADSTHLEQNVHTVLCTADGPVQAVHIRYIHKNELPYDRCG